MVPADERVPSSSRGDVQGVIHIGDVTNPEYVSNADKVSRTPSGEVGIAISSSPPPEDCFDPSISASRHQESDQESRWSSRHTHKSSEYAGPHRSVIDSHLPQLGVASDVSLRHRLPPRAAIAPIVHPYRSAPVQSGQVGNKRGEAATFKVTEGQEAMELDTRCSPHPHLSLSHADFERYGVGEALVYASCSRSEVPEVKQADVQTESLPATESPPPREHSPSCETVVLPPEERDTSSLEMDSIPSLTHSTIQMVMSAFDDPDDLDEFQDLFYKPHPAPGGQQLEPGATIDQVPADTDDSTPSSPLTHLVRKLSEEVKSLRNPSRTPSDPISLQRSESQDQRSNEGGTRFVFMDMTRPSSSPLPMESSSQLHVTIQQECCGTIAQRVTVIPEDVHSSYTSSVLDSPSDDHENDTFGKDAWSVRSEDFADAMIGYPVKHGQLEAVTAPTPVQTTLRVSTHLSIQEDEDEDEEEDTAFLSPVTKRFGLASVDAVRASYVTTSDISRMSGLSDFPLPPGMRPLSILQAYFDATPVSPTSQSHSYYDDETEMGHAGRPTGGEEDGEQPGDVGETLRALRMTPRVTSYESHRSTFGGSDSDDVDYITQLHQACP
ncbi:hypothetical protein JVT61DRAFT_15131 [Boletus reticuloceps]|uniref:Uncharacterized protein n=1 Tax=Boletus reticuloceps TaxID=495285 RepID=A0A8I2YSG5_9AGAM|nr:hypothetical protein JVT61DRAFT_15131 [Boletus reticuloceps]